MQTPEGKMDLQDGDFVVIADVIIASVIGGPWVVMDEFGTGSLSDRFNPALQDYFNSELWNPARGNDLTIRSRERGMYTNIFGEQVESKSNVAGVDLEQLGGKFEPQVPSHALETTMRWMRTGRMKEKIAFTIQAFPFNKFIITDIK